MHTKASRPQSRVPSRQRAAAIFGAPGCSVPHWLYGRSSVHPVVGGLEDESALLSQVIGDLALPAVPNGPVMPEYPLTDHVCRGVIPSVLFFKLGGQIRILREFRSDGAVGFIPDAARIVVTPLCDREASNVQEQNGMPRLKTLNAAKSGILPKHPLGFACSRTFEKSRTAD